MKEFQKLDDQQPGSSAVVESPVTSLLRKARTILIERGWCQGTFAQGWNGPHCAVGAVYAATGWRPGLSFPSNDTTNMAIHRLGSIASGMYKGASIVMLNDHIAKKAEDVIAVFDKAVNG